MKYIYILLDGELHRTEAATLAAKIESIPAITEGKRFEICASNEPELTPAQFKAIDLFTVKLPS